MASPASQLMSALLDCLVRQDGGVYLPVLHCISCVKMSEQWILVEKHAALTHAGEVQSEYSFD